MRLRVSVVNRSGRRAGIRGLGPWLARTAPARARGDVSVAIVPDRLMRTLNKRFRRKDRATDVLSFPGERPFLGEIVIAQGVAARQAKALGHSLTSEYRVLALHGLLHLLGYDHEVDNGAMARLEARLRRRAGLPAGLIARSS